MNKTRFAFLACLVLVAGAVFSQPLETYSDPTALRDALSGEDIPFRLIDVRTPTEYRTGFIAGAENIDYRRIGAELADEDRDQPIVLYCRSGSRARTAENTLREMGFSNVLNFGGVIDWPFELVVPENQ